MLCINSEIRVTLFIFSTSRNEHIGASHRLFIRTLGQFEHFHIYTRLRQFKRVVHVLSTSIIIFSCNDFSLVQKSCATKHRYRQSIRYRSFFHFIAVCRKDAKAVCNTATQFSEGVTIVLLKFYIRLFSAKSSIIRRTKL